MGTPTMSASKLALFLVVFVTLLWPIYAKNIAKNITNSTGGNNTSFSRLKNLTKVELVSCEWGDVRPTYSVIAAVISGFLILAGAILCTIGYKQERAAFSLLGFTVAGLVGYAIVEYKFDYSMGIQLLITGAIALFVSILCSSVMYCGIFLTGLATGFSFGCVVIVVIMEIHTFSSFAEPILILIGLAIAFASASLWWKRTFVILGTSVVGGTFVMGGMDYFIEGFLFVEYVQHIIYGREYRKLCYFSWIVFAIFPVMAIAGLLIQHFKTAKRLERPKSVSHQELAMNRLSETSHQSRV